MRKECASWGLGAVDNLLLHSTWNHKASGEHKASRTPKWNISSSTIKVPVGIKKMLSTLDILWELQVLIILEVRENAALRAQLLFYARALHLWRAFVTRFSAVFRAALTEIVRFSRPLSGENGLYCTLNALWVLRGVLLAGCALVLTINHSTSRAAGPVTQLRGREVTVSSLPHTSIRVHDVSVQPIPVD